MTPKKRIELSAFSQPIVLPLYDDAKQRLPLATDKAASTSVTACLGATVQGTRILEPHLVSAVTFKADEKFVPPRDLVLESGDDDGRFVPTAVDGHKAVVGDGFVLPVASESDDPIELKSTTHFSVSTIDNEDGDEWFETKTGRRVRRRSGRYRTSLRRLRRRRQRRALRREGVL